MEKFVTLSKIKRKRKHGFLKRSKDYKGQQVLASRRSKGRKSLSL